MQHWNRLAYRKKTIIRASALFATAIVALAIIGQAKSDASREEIQKLEAISSIHLPLDEISGLGLTRDGDLAAPRLVAVGDRMSRLTGVMAKDERLVSLGSHDFDAAVTARLSPCPVGAVGKVCDDANKDLNSQWEAVQTDGSGKVFLLQEYSRALYVLGEDLTTLEGIINFDLGASVHLPPKSEGKIKRKRLDDYLSGEGFLLLKNGHILVAKEKTPIVLVELGPAGDAPLGINAASLLKPDETFTWGSKLPALATGGLLRRESYVALATWALKGLRDCDISEIAAGPDATIYVLSQQCRLLQKVGSLVVGKPDVEISTLWRIPSRINNPEGLAVTPGGDFVVGSDQRGVGDNLFLLRAPKAPSVDLSSAQAK